MSTPTFLLERESIPIPKNLARRLREKLKTRASDAAILIQQLHYWLCKEQGFLHTDKKTEKTHRWIWNTYEGWREQFSWLSDWDFRIIVKALREIGLILFEQLLDCGRNRTGCYRLNYEHEWLKALTHHHPLDITTDGTGEIPTPAFDDCTTDITKTTSTEITSDTTTVVVEKETVEADNSAIAISPFVQESLNTDSPPLVTTEGQGEFSAAPQKEEIALLSGRSPTSTSIERKQVLEKLRSLNIKLDDAISVSVKKHFDNCSGAIAALEEAINKNRCRDRRGYFLKAVREGWKPEDIRPTLNKIEELPPGILEQLKQKFRSVIEIPFNGSWCWGVIVGSHGGSVLPWWEALKLGGPS